MSRPRTSYTEIVIRFVPTPWNESPSSSDGDALDGTRSYSALVYTAAFIPGLGSIDRTAKGRPREIGDLPLAGVERLVVRWGRYYRYLQRFLEGSADVTALRGELLDEWLRDLSPVIIAILTGNVPTDRRLRVWWSSESPEVEVLPWELLGLTASEDNVARCSVVRGLPPELPLPTLAVRDRLRVAFIHDPTTTHPELIDALLQSPPPGLEVVPFTDPPRQAIKAATRDWFEIIHLVSDGTINLAYEGSLRGADPTETPIAARELSALLNGSPVTVLAFSSNRRRYLERGELGGYLMPTVYRAFVSLAGCPLPLPNVVAPVGPPVPNQIRTFWQGFYSGLCETLRLEDAMAAGQANGGPAPVALFLRHRRASTFRRAQPGESLPVDPNRIRADLQLSRNLLTHAQALEPTSGRLHELMDQLVKEEQSRQRRLADELEPYVGLEGDEA
jgi:hypothetical protein